jgi:hypothetical protein
VPPPEDAVSFCEESRPRWHGTRKWFCRASPNDWVPTHLSNIQIVSAKFKTLQPALAPLWITRHSYPIRSRTGAHVRERVRGPKRWRSPQSFSNALAAEPSELDHFAITLIPQELTGQRILVREQLPGRAFEHDLAALRAAFGAQVDDPVGMFDHSQRLTQGQVILKRVAAICDEANRPVCCSLAAASACSSPRD